MRWGQALNGVKMCIPFIPTTLVPTYMKHLKDNDANVIILEKLLKEHFPELYKVLSQQAQRMTDQVRKSIPGPSVEPISVT